MAPAFLGHLRPLCAVARAVHRRGHRVTFLTVPDGVTRVVAQGFQGEAYGGRLFPPGEWDQRAAAMGRAEGRAVYRHSLQLLVDHSRGIAEDLPGLVTRLRLDGLVMDQLGYGAEGVAEVTGIPLVVACCALPMHRESRVPLCIRHWAWRDALWARARNRVDGALNLLGGWRMSVVHLQHRRALGLRPPALSDLNEVRPSLAQISQLPEFLDFPRSGLPEHFHYTAPWQELTVEGEENVPWDQLDGRPFVYASLGTLQNGVDRHYATIAAACAQVGVRLVLALGRPVVGPMPDLPGRPLVLGFAPQQRLLDRATAVITHAGLNTVLETVSRGLPMVTIPIAHEQPGNAARLRRAGVAISIPVRRLTTARLATALEECLRNPGYRERALACAARLRQLDGPAAAAEIIEQACLSRRKILRKTKCAGL